MSDIEHYDKIRDGWLLDTNILSATMGRRNPQPAITKFFQSINDDRFRISVITIGEIKKGIDLIRPPHRVDYLTWSKSTEAARRDELSAKLEIFESAWADRILPIDIKISKTWGEFQAHYQSRGKPIPAIDTFIAATAYVHNLVVVSNDGTFKQMRDRITLYDPFTTKS